MRDDGAPHVVELVGEIDLLSVPEAAALVEAALAREDCTELEVDCTNVTFIDSRGLSMMVRMQRVAEESETSLVWTNPPPQVLTAIGTAGLDRYLTISVSG